MSAFSRAEIEYMAEQRLGRIATVGAGGEPHVVPVTFRYNSEADTIDVGGHGIAKSKKFRDVARGQAAAFVVDDVRPPWRPRMIEVRGRAEALADGGREVNEDFDPEVIRITPQRILSFGIDGDDARSARTVEPFSN